MDNRYYKNGCPPLMADSRFITSYVDSSVVNQYIRHVNKIKTANDYRSFLQKNGENIMDKERAFLMNKNTCGVKGKCVKISNETSFELESEDKCRGMCKCYQ